MMYDSAVFIGRFQPFHNGHAAVILAALERAEEVIVLIGSADSSRTPRNPFTEFERETMIRNWASEAGVLKRIQIFFLSDHMYNDSAWIAEVQSIVAYNTFTDAKIALAGMNKDHTSYYLKLFPQWESIDVPAYTASSQVLSSTDIRKDFLEGKIDRSRIPVATYNVLTHLDREDLDYIRDEHAFCERYKQIFANLPYPVTIQTVDPVVVQSGHILLVRRGEHPGKGKLALPGGHIDPNERLVDACVRELKEETRIADHRGEIPPEMLKSFITKEKTYDHPYRSSRGRVITQAFLFNLPARTKLFKVRGDSDATSARWYPLGSLNSTEFHDDHYHIIRDLVG